MGTDDNNVDTTNIQDVRSILLGDENELITRTIKNNARELVTNVISEAMHDREQRDKSLSQSLLPLIEQAIKQSVEQNKSTLINYLYPIVGSLVRKYVSVFFNHFLERLNTLIEYSLTLKGIKWRIEAFKQGIPFPQFIMGKTFLFRVEQVFFIHKETGLLLGNSAQEGSEFSDPHLISAMLSAINEFMADSFNPVSSDGIETIKTEQLTLLIQTGPQALLVTAISGNAPYNFREQLSQKIEFLHAFYHDALTHFSGDDSEFSNSAIQLQDCLISELKPENIRTQKRPVLAITTIAILLLGFTLWMAQLWQNNNMLKQLSSLPSTPGIVLQKVEYSQSAFQLNIWRDPYGITPKLWLEHHDIPLEQVIIHEQAFASLEPSIILAKAQKIVEHSKLPLTLTLEKNTLLISGDIKQILPRQLTNQLLSVPGIHQLDIKKLNVSSPFNSSSEQTRVAQQALLEKQISGLALMSIDFDVQSEVLNEQGKSLLADVAQNIKVLELLSEKINTPVGVIISGYSDSSGATQKNKNLSQDRAEIVKEYLTDLGVNNTLLFAVGVGEVKIPAVASASRKVVFSTISLNEFSKGDAL